MHQAEDGMLRCSVFKNSAYELGAIMVPHCEHDEKSPIYKFQQGVDDQPWTWEEMVAHFDDESLDKVFHGVKEPQLRPGGRRIVACAIQEIAIGDHKKCKLGSSSRLDQPNLNEDLVDPILVEDGSTVPC